MSQERGATRATPPAMLVVATRAITIRAFLQPYARHFRSLGWRVDAAAGGLAGANLEDVFDRLVDIPASRSLRDPRSLVGMYRGLRAALADGRYDIVHVHTPIAAFVARLAVRRLPRTRRPSIAYTAHGFHFHARGHPVSNAMFVLAERVAGRWTDRLVVINEEDRQAARRHRIVPPERLVAMPGIGIDTGRFSREAVPQAAIDRIREELDLSPRQPVFVMVAEFTPRKRHRDALQALASMRGRDAVLVLAGSGPGQQAMEAEAIRLGIQDRVRFMGFVADVRPLVASASALLLPSSREGLPRSIMEALALEVPAVVSDARGHRELVGDDAGIVVPVGDVAALSQAMDRLASNPAAAAQMGRRGRARMEEAYGEERLIEAHERLYASMLDERRARLGSR